MCFVLFFFFPVLLGNEGCLQAFVFGGHFQHSLGEKKHYNRVGEDFSPHVRRRSDEPYHVFLVPAPTTSVAV